MNLTFDRLGGTAMHFPTPTLDDQDREIIAERMAKYDRKEGPRQGDWVIFADGVTRRVACVNQGEVSDSVQTCNDGRFYLATGGVDCSAACYLGVPSTTLTLTSETRAGSVWIFSHDMHSAGNGVDGTAPFRVYTCTENAPTC